MEHIRKAYPWPEKRPDAHVDNHGWFTQSGHINFLVPFTGVHIRNVVELGSWLGASTRWFCRQCPNATVYAIDHWKGSPENFKDNSVSGKIPTLYETFLINCWHLKNQLVPVRESTLKGMEAICEVAADLVYIDAAHDMASVLADIALAHQIWPDAQLCGDDWPHGPVQEGVRAALEIANASGKEYEIVTGGRCWAWKLVEGAKTDG